MTRQDLSVRLHGGIDNISRASAAETNCAISLFHFDDADLPAVQARR